MNFRGHAIAGLCAIVLATACSSSIGAESDGLRGWPERPANATTPSTGLPRATRTFAATAIRLGSDDTWRGLGYDLDGLRSIKGSDEACRLRFRGAGADGLEGIDNSFGQNVLTVLGLFMGSSGMGDLELEVSQNRAITSGAFTLLFQTNGLADGTAAADGLTAQLFVAGSKVAGSPKGAMDRWMAHADYVRDGNPSRARTRFDRAYINQGTFVSGAPTTIDLALHMQGKPLALRLERAVVTWTPSGSELTRGVIAGILSLNDLVESVQTFGRKVSPATSCHGELDKTMAILGNYTDILLDGTRDPARECDGISFAIGFTAREVEAPAELTAPLLTDKDPCAAP